MQGAADKNATLLSQLNERLAEAERAIFEKQYMCEASVPLDGPQHLCWVKHAGTWGLYVNTENGTRVPIAQASVKSRVLAAHALKVLHDQLLLSADRQNISLLRATEAARAS